MDRLRKLELIQRSLGLRHKLKVHESMKTADNHEDIAIMLVTKWEFEDELRAIEEILAENRQKNVSAKKTVLLKKELDIPGLSPGERDEESGGPGPRRAKTARAKA